MRPEADADLPLPERATPDSAGFDLRAAEGREFEPGETAAVPTGFALAIPAGFEGQVRPRSGLSLRTGLRLANAPGTIDADYRGEVHVLLHNLGSGPISIARGDRVAQLVIAPVIRAELDEVEVGALRATDRGAGGFGSTGKR